MSNNNKGSSKKSLRGLDYTNFFLADLREGVGPYLSVYLKGLPQWNPGLIGIAIATSTITQVIAQVPAGALIDRLRQKRMLIVIGVVLTAIGCLGIAFLPAIPVVIGAQVMIGIAGAIFLPTVAAIALGLVERRQLDRRIGRNETFYHAGNLVFAVIAGLIAQFVSRQGIFVFLAVYAAASGISVLRIRAREINHERARGGAEDEGEGNGGQKQYAGIGRLLRDRRIQMFALAIILFHFANSPMLSLVGQLFEQQASKTAVFGAKVDSIAYMSASIIVAQIVMTPVANLSGRLASGGRKRIFLVGFAVVPLRGVLYAFSQNPFYLIALEAIDGIGAGIFWVVAVLMTADLTKGTGRFNFTQGFVNACFGIGSGLGNLLAGFVASSFGYTAGLLMLAVIGLGALAVFWFFVPETKE